MKASANWESYYLSGGRGCRMPKKKKGGSSKNAESRKAVAMTSGEELHRPETIYPGKKEKKLWGLLYTGTAILERKAEALEAETSHL